MFNYFNSLTWYFGPISRTQRVGRAPSSSGFVQVAFVRAVDSSHQRGFRTQTLSAIPACIWCWNSPSPVRGTVGLENAFNPLPNIPVARPSAHPPVSACTPCSEAQERLQNRLRPDPQPGGLCSHLRAEKPAGRAAPHCPLTAVPGWQARCSSKPPKAPLSSHTPCSPHVGPGFGTGQTASRSPDSSLPPLCCCSRQDVPFLGPSPSSFSLLSARCHLVLLQEPLQGGGRGRSGPRGHRYTCGWFTLMFGRNPPNMAE